jgi:hypothetical protein
MNFILDGDPVPPVLHLALHRPDAQFSVADARQMSSGLRTSTSPIQLLIVPIRFFSDTLSHDFIDYGANLAVTFMYAPFIAIGYVLVRRRGANMPANVLVLAAAFVYGFSYWVLTSHHARFFLEIMPVYFAALGTLAIWIVRRQAVIIKVLAFAIVLAGVVPSPSAWAPLYSMYVVDYFGITAYIPNREFFNENWCDGCQEADYVRSHLKSGGRVFTLDLMNLTYLLRERGIENIVNRYSSFGDAEFFEAVEDRDLLAYVSRLSIGAFLVNTNTAWPDDSRALFIQQAGALGFHPYEYPRPRKDGHIIVYVR